MINKSISSETDAMFAHLFLQAKDQSVEYISSFAGVIGQLEEFLKESIADYKIDADANYFVTFSSDGQARPLSDLYGKRLNYKSFSKFSNIILSLESECKKSEFFLFYLININVNVIIIFCVSQANLGTRTRFCFCLRL